MFPLQDTNPSRSAPVVNTFLILASVLVFLMQISMTQSELTQFVRHWGVVPARFVYSADAWQIATIFTSMFMHGGWLHLVSNMWALFIFGDNVEDRLGHFNYFMFYLFCGVVACMVQVFAGPQANGPVIGASGAIAGVLGAYALLFPAAQVTTMIPIVIIPFFIRIPAYFYLGMWFVMQVLSGFSIVHGAAAMSTGEEHVAFFAHIGGFITGLLLVNLLKKQNYRQFAADEYWPY